MLVLSVYTLPGQFRTAPFSIISTKTYDSTGLFRFDIHVDTCRIVSYRRLPLATYPPEMNGTAAWVTDGMPTSHCNGLYESITVIIRLHNTLRLSTAPGPCLRLSRWLLYFTETTY
jgi:hypothetical protein